MYIKFKAYNEEELLDGPFHRDTAMIECDEYRHHNWWVSNGAELLIILDAEADSWSPIWELPVRSSNIPWPGDGLSLSRFIVLRRGKWETVFSYDCAVYVMSDSGKTIDRI